jgi:exopolyphosphatase/guanosine-5'-triphosphate,3'-diphosphate pyrophosphatase
VSSDPPSKADRARLEQHVRRTLEPVAEQVRQLRPRTTVGTSGTLDDLAVMAVAARTGEVPPGSNGLRVARGDFLALHERIMRSKASERRKLPGVDERRVELLPAGSTFLAVASEVFDFDELVVSDWALREGIVLDAVRHHDPDDWSDDPRALRRAAVAGLARRCNSDVAHCAQVARIALELFDRTQLLHGLGPRDRELLEYAVLLHDIGQHVSRRGHHRHAAYLVEHGDLRGFAPDEIAFLAALVRHHRRGEPKATEPRYAALDAADRDRLRKLAALLRVADGLDRGRRSTVGDLEIEVGAQLVIVRLDTGDDAELELWGARRRRDLFEREFDRELEVVVRRRRPSGG